MENIYDVGMKLMKKSMGKEGEQTLNNFGRDFEDIGKYIIEFVFADLGTRGILKTREREMITIVSLISQGDTASQLKMHYKSALKAGMDKKELIEVILQCIPHVGFPKVLNAVQIAQGVLNQSEYEN